MFPRTNTTELMDALDMYNEPSPDLTADFVEKAIDEINTESELAALFAEVDTKAWEIACEVSDFDEGAEECERATADLKVWFALADKLRNKIFEILRAEGVEIPDTNQITVLEPFMKRNGFYDANGWWTETRYQK